MPNSLSALSRADLNAELLRGVEAGDVDRVRDALAILDPIATGAPSPASTSAFAQQAMSLACKDLRPQIIEALAPHCSDETLLRAKHRGQTLLEAVSASSLPRALECVQLLFRRVDWHSQETPCHALHSAATGGNEEIARFLLPHFYPNKAEKNGWLAFHHAVASGNVRLIQLLASVSDTRARLNTGHDALMIAAMFEQEQAIPFLLSLGVYDTRTSDRDGNTALMNAVERRKIKAVALLAPISDLRQRNKLGKTPFDRARELRSPESLDLLLGDRDRFEIEKILADFGASALPRARAALERMELSDAVAQSAPGPAANAEEPRKRPPPRAL